MPAALGVPADVAVLIVEALLAHEIVEDTPDGPRWTVAPTTHEDR